MIYTILHVSVIYFLVTCLPVASDNDILTRNKRSFPAMPAPPSPGVAPDTQNVPRYPMPPPSAYSSGQMSSSGQMPVPMPAPMPAPPAPYSPYPTDSMNSPQGLQRYHGNPYPSSGSQAQVYPSMPAPAPAPSGYYDPSQGSSPMYQQSMPPMPMPPPGGPRMSPAMREFMQDLKTKWQQFLQNVTDRYQSSPLREQWQRFRQHMTSRGGSSEIPAEFPGGPPPPPPGFPPNQGFPPPGQGFPPPNQGFPAPNQGFPAPNQGFPRSPNAFSTPSYQYSPTGPPFESSSASSMTTTAVPA